VSSKQSREWSWSTRAVVYTLMPVCVACFVVLCALPRCGSGCARALNRVGCCRARCVDVRDMCVLCRCIKVIRAPKRFTDTQTTLGMA